MIPIVFSTDHNFVMPTCVTIHSLLQTAKKGVKYEIFVIINKDVTEEDKELLIAQVKQDNEECKIDFINIGDTFVKSFEVRDISVATYSRLMIPWLLTTYDRVIYSDVDIIFKEDISDVYQIDMEGKLVAGHIGEGCKKGLLRRYINKIGGNPENYVNAGFLVMNCKLQREQKLKERYLELATKQFLFQDQDIINLVCKGKIGSIPATYDMNPAEAYNYEKGAVKLIHYAGLKPWDYFTYSWCDWWEVYKSSMVYDPQRNKILSRRILSFSDEIKKRKKMINRKLKFYREYIKLI